MLTLSMPFKKNQLVKFNPLNARIDSQQVSDQKIQGNADIVGSHTIALYAESGRLYLQIDKNRWRLDDDGLQLTYHHKVATKTTIFCVEFHQQTTCIEYPCWWSHLGDTLPPIPEMEVDEDYLAYVHCVWEDKLLQSQLLKSWS